MENPFKNLFKIKDSRVVGIDIGTSAVKIVQLKKKGNKAVLETYGSISLGSYDQADVGKAVTNLSGTRMIEALSDLLKESTVTTKQSCVSIPLNSSLISTIELPLVNDKELKEMVPLEARKYIPVPISDVSLDWTVLSREEHKIQKPKKVSSTEANSIESKGMMKTDGNVPQENQPRSKLTVLIVAIHNEALKKFNEYNRKNGLEPSFFEIEIFSTMRAVLDQGAEPVMIFDLGAASTKLYIIENGVIKISHSVNKGSQDITIAISKAYGVPFEKAEIIKRSLEVSGKKADKEFADVVTNSLEYIFSESNRVILNYQTKYSKTLSKVILVGGGVGIKGFIDLAKTNFQVEAVLGNPFSKIETPAFLDNVFKTIGPEFSVAVGVALRGLQEV